MKVFAYSSRHTVQKQWVKTCQRAGIAHLTPHEAGRHGFGTQTIVRARIDPVTAARAGGWSSPRVMTETYAHAGHTEAAVQAAFRRK
jgi:integrase